MYRLFNMIIQISRGKNITTTREVVPQLCYSDDNVTMELRKEQVIIFGFNNHNADHIIYGTFVQSIFPLTDEVQKELDNNDISYFNDPTFMNNIGLTVIRGTTKVNNKNLSQRVFDLGNWLNENKPEVYDSLFRGGERQFNAERYSYRKDLITGAKFFNPKEFYWKDMNKYWFTKIKIGAYYADSIKGQDDATQILIGFEFDKEEFVEGIYILEEQSISSTEFKDMTEKVDSMVNKINSWSQIYHNLKEEFNYLIGHNARTVGHFVRKTLLENNDWKNMDLDITRFSTILVTGAKGWSVQDRHYKWKRLLSEGKIYFSNNLDVYKTFNDKEILVKKMGIYIKNCLIVLTMKKLIFVMKNLA
ncbi:hypothetical protein [Spiroplasma endosymbiont of Sarcophaga carnaria]|uniref:hypothetical protein n=1 Tax=Spiroplasma endosymbiont of Sarcophaga carnaria TaxID=3066303 RepID=UPI0030D16E28